MTGDEVGSGRLNPSGTALWDAHASWWKRTFTGGADPEYDREIIPIVLEELAGAQLVLDLGCGEGQVSRALAVGVVGERPPAVIGIDPSFAQLANAGAEPAPAAAPRYCQGQGERLPFADRTFDAVVCCLAIEHADDADALLKEVSRVLTPGGRFLLLINHPMYQGPGSGLIDDQILGERYWRIGPYLHEQVSVEEVDSGVAIPFAHRPLSRYVNPLAANDVLLTAMREPPPIPEFLAGSVAPELEAEIPRLLVLRFELRPRS